MKLLFIGLDGLSWETFEQFEMPFLEALSGQGVRGRLLSFEDPYMCTGPVWTSIQTGLAPEKHGVTGPRAGNWHTAALNRDVKTVWRTLNEQDVTCGLVNFPVTYPLRPVRDFVVCGFPAPWEPEGTQNPWERLDLGGRLFWPSELEPHIGGFRSAWMNYVEPDEFEDTHAPYRAAREGDPDARAYMMGLLYRSLHETERLALTLSREHPVDLLAAVFMETDTLGHMGAAVPAHERAAMLREADDVARQLVAATQPENVIVMSDHGCWELAHTREGVFLAAGPAFASVDEAEVEILEVAPTVLYLWDAYEPAMAREPAYRMLASGQVGDEQSSRIRERLRAMGYLE